MTAQGDAAAAAAGPATPSATPAAPPAHVAPPARALPGGGKAQAIDGPVLIWFEIAEEQNVFPMMPAGKGLSDLIETWGAPEE